MNEKYHVCRNGRIKGIFYTTYDYFRTLVDGYSNKEHRAFLNLNDAKNYWYEKYKDIEPTIYSTKDIIKFNHKIKIQNHLNVINNQINNIKLNNNDYNKINNIKEDIKDKFKKDINKINTNIKDNKINDVYDHNDTNIINDCNDSNNNREINIKLSKSNNIKIEKINLDNTYHIYERCTVIENKLNEIIDYINNH